VLTALLEVIAGIINTTSNKLNYYKLLEVSGHEFFSFYYLKNTSKLELESIEGNFSSKVLALIEVVS